MRTLVLAGLLATAAVTTTGVPVAAQTTDNVIIVEERTSELITVTGNEQNRRPYSLSKVVSARDLDLTRESDQAVLRMRVAVAARDVCTQLNQAPPGPGNLGYSCETTAIRNARDQMQVAFANARPAYAASAFGDEASARVPDTTNPSYSAPVTAPSPDAPPPDRY